MRYSLIASGSKGNCLFIQEKDTNILIDFGVSKTRVNEELERYNTNLEGIDALFYTHNHSDHFRLSSQIKRDVVYALDGILPEGYLYHPLKMFTPFTIKDLTLTPIKTSHDTYPSCGFVIESDSEKLVYLTDTGMFIEQDLDYIVNPDYLILESNHDIKLLMASDRSYELKSRILSDSGHLCNEDSAFLASRIVGPKTKEVILAHLSEECNTPELALNAYKKTFKNLHKKMNFSLKCGKQYEAVRGPNED
ncbi:MAG: MBL fold metallo-hydrolase [Coprobacillus sp.]|nr:MBL fold metallo-hydrolase [Coprobacillus sp.]